MNNNQTGNKPENLGSVISDLFQVTLRVENAIFGDKPEKTPESISASSKFAHAVVDIAGIVDRLSIIADELEKV